MDAHHNTNTGTLSPVLGHMPCTQYDQPKPAGRLGKPPLPRQLEQRHHVTQECNQGNALILSIDVPKAVQKPHRLLAHVHAHRRNRQKPECSMMWNILYAPPQLNQLIFR